MTTYGVTVDVAQEAKGLFYDKYQSDTVGNDPAAGCYDRLSTLLSLRAVFALLLVFCPRTGKPIACLLPIYEPTNR